MRQNYYRHTYHITVNAIFAHAYSRKRCKAKFSPQATEAQPQVSSIIEHARHHVKAKRRHRTLIRCFLPTPASPQPRPRSERLARHAPPFPATQPRSLRCLRRLLVCEATSSSRRNSPLASKSHYAKPQRVMPPWY